MDRHTPFALVCATSSAEFKIAVDELPRDAKYYTAEVRDVILRKQQFIVDSATADSVMSFFDKFTDVPANRPPLRTPEIRDLIINILAPKISAGNPVGNLGRSICGITFQRTPSTDLYSTPESLKAILSCFHRATTVDGAEWIAGAIHNILNNNPTAKKLFNDLPVVEAFSAVLPHATSDDAVERVSNSLQKILFNNPDAQKMLGTPSFLQKFKVMEKFATADDANTPFKVVLDILQPVVNHRMEEPLRDATTSLQLTSALNTIIKQSDCWPTLVDLFLSKQHLIQDEASTTSTAKFINWCFEKNEKSIRKKEIYELLQNVLLPKSLNFPNYIPHFHESLALIVRNKEAQEFFSTYLFKEYITASLPHANESVLKLLNSLLVDNKKRQEIFGTPDFNEIICERFAENPSASSLLDTFRKIMNECFAPVRFNSLKKLATDHNEAIPERILRQLAKSGVDGASVFECENVAFTAGPLGLKVDDAFAVSRFVKNIKDKNNGVAPIHQDPFTLFELDKLRQEHDDLRKLHQDLITSSSKSIDDLEKSRDDTKKQLQTSQQQNATLQSQLDAISPFVRDKFYQIDSNVNNLPPPQAGVVERHPVAETTRIFAEAEKLMKKSGTLIYDAASPNEFKFSSVKGFTLQSVDVILRGAAGFEERMAKLQGLRLNVTDKFNPAFAAFSPEQQQVLKVLFEHFLPRPPSSNPKFPNLVNVFHGTRVDRLDAAMNGLVAMRSTDDGFFGFGCYSTTSIEYAAQYARGDFSPNAPAPRADGSYPVLWCVAAVGVCHPVSRADDYSKNRVHTTNGRVSNFFGSPLNKDCDCHCALVGGSQAYQAVPPKDMEYMEIVVDQEAQVIPIAVLWVKP